LNEKGATARSFFDPPPLHRSDEPKTDEVEGFLLVFRKLAATRRLNPIAAPFAKCDTPAKERFVYSEAVCQGFPIKRG
jgi:hypothetical protein